MEPKSQEKSTRGMNWVWGFGLIALGAVFMLGQFVGGMGALVGAIIFGGIGLTFFVIYQQDRSRWWALIPTYIAFVIAGIIVLGSYVSGPLTGAFVMFAICLPFLYVYLKNRTQWWALIPAYATAVIGVLILLSDVAVLRGRHGGELLGAYFMLAAALPFLYVYLRNRAHWWALIPGGIMASIGVGLLFSALAYVIPGVMIVFGIYLLAHQLISPRQKKSESSPKTGPEADKPSV